METGGEANIDYRLIGFKESEETKAKRSKSLKGRPSPFKGISLSEEHKRKLSESAKAGKTGKFKRTDSMNVAQSLKLKGRKRTIEMKEHYKNAALNRSKKLCIYCQREIAINCYRKVSR